MGQITIEEALKDIKINQLQEEIKRLKEENINLKNIILYQSYEQVGMKPQKLTLLNKNEKGKPKQSN